MFLCVLPYAKDTYENNVFSINSIEATDKPGQILFMYLPASESFAPNINVLSQNYTGTIKEYLDITNEELKKYNLKIIKSKITEDSILIEYAGKMEGKELHFYAMAYKKNDLIYLATGTSLETQWATVSKKIIPIIDSFKLKK